MKPYETIQEVLEAGKIHGPYIKRSSGSYYLITAIYNIGENNWSCVLGWYPKSALTPKEFLTECVWQDGSPCGKNEN